MVSDPAARPHVMRVYSRLEVGGIEKQMLRVLPRLNAGRYRASLCLLKRPGELADELRALGVAVHVLPFKGRLAPTSLLALAKLFRAQGVSIVHAHVRESNTSATVAAKLARVPVIIASIHNVDTMHGGRRLLQDRFLDRWRDAVVTVSDKVRDDYCAAVGIDPAKCVTIHNGLDLEAFTSGGRPRDAVRSELGLAPADRAVITVARLVTQKGHEVLLQAAARVVAAVPGARFLVAGEGHRLEELRAMAQSLGVGERVRFLGPRADVPDLDRASEVACLTSWREGFSNVVVESLASGLPVVATDVGGNREAVEEGVSGFLVPAGDAPAIAARLIELLRDEPLRARMAEAARRRAERFGIDETVRKTEALYDRLLASKGVPVR